MYFKEMLFIFLANGTNWSGYVGSRGTIPNVINRPRVQYVASIGSRLTESKNADVTDPGTCFLTPTVYTQNGEITIRALRHCYIAVTQTSLTTR